LNNQIGPADVWGLSPFEQYDNIRLALESARAIGVQVSIYKPVDLIETNKYPSQSIDFLWELIKTQLLQNVKLSLHPELIRLLNPSEIPAEFNKLLPESILLRWVNYVIKVALLDDNLATIIARSKIIFIYINNFHFKFMLIYYNI